MKNRVVSLMGLAALAAAGHAAAQEQGRVISTTPVVQQVAVPRQVCSNEQITSSTQQKSGAGALMGGIAGGAMGNAAGQGSGRAALTMIGIFGGAILGDKLEGGQAQSNTQNVQRCTTQTFYENKPIAYNVVYEFNGKQYQVQMPQDPGPYVSLQVTPVGGTPVQPAQPAPAPAQVNVRPVTVAPVYQQPVVIESSTVYVQPVYSQPVYSQPVYTQHVYARPVHPHPGYTRPIVVRPAPVVYVQPYRHDHHRYPHPGQVYTHPRHGTHVNIGYSSGWR
jgi:uncharacterized protein YcfJ